MQQLWQELAVMQQECNRTPQECSMNAAGHPRNATRNAAGMQRDTPGMEQECSGTPQECSRNAAGQKCRNTAGHPLPRNALGIQAEFLMHWECIRNTGGFPNVLGIPNALGMH